MIPLPAGFLKLLGGAAALVGISLTPSWADDIRVGPWKTPQTIQPFFYEQFLSQTQKVKVHSFTNPADQKTALLAGSLDMCGTTLAHAIHSASLGQPVVVVAALCNKCSALVVKKGGSINKVADLKGKRSLPQPAFRKKAGLKGISMLSWAGRPTTASRTNCRGAISSG